MAASYARAIAGHTLAFSIRLAWTTYSFPACPPAAGMHSAPVCVAARPSASTMPTWRTSRLASPARSAARTSGAARPAFMRDRPRGP